MMKRIALSFLLASTIAAVPKLAQAQHKSPLADAPAIRKRVELRDKRFELSLGAGSTLNETFYHDILLNAHLAFHITDWLSIGGVGIFGVTTLSTGFNDELSSTLSNPPTGRAPALDASKAGMNKLGAVYAGQIELTPFAGKFSLFGKLFAHYDFYLFGGPALVSLKQANSAGVTENGAQITACVDKATSKMVQTCYVTGNQIGGTFGGGFHAFLNDFLAINVELRDVLNKDNPAGRDVNGDQFVDKGDLTWSSHWMSTIGLTLYLPPKADISP